MVATKRSKKKVKKVKKKVRNSRKTKNIVMTNKIVSQNFRNRRVPHFSGGFSGAGGGGGGGSSSSSSSSPGFFIQQPMPFPPRPPDTNKFLFQKSVIESFDNSNKNLGNILNKLDNLNISQEIVNGILQVNLNDNNDDILTKSEISSLTSPSFDNYKSDMDVSKTSNLSTSKSDMDISKNSLKFQPAEIQPAVEIEMVSMDQSKGSQLKDEKDEKKPPTELTTNQAFDEYDYAPRVPGTTVLGKRRALYGMEIDDNSIQSSVIDPVITRNIHDVIADRTEQARQRGDLLSITDESYNNL